MFPNTPVFGLVTCNRILKTETPTYDKQSTTLDKTNRVINGPIVIQYLKNYRDCKTDWD
ncbi:hypothetical protein Hanom_Chr12g01175521 [Helianthus anomalus]